jgi:WD40 repeat protein
MQRPFSFAILTMVLLVAPLFADAKNPTYDDDVLPILKQHCVSCHSADKMRGGLNLATFTAAMEGGSSGVVIAAGDSGKSRLYTLTAHTEEPKMPPKADRIPQAQIDLLKLWIEQGGRENAGSKVTVVKPKIDIGLKAVGKGKPEGPPPMPLAGKYKVDQLVRARRPGAVLALATSPWAPLVAIGGQKQVLLYHTETQALLGTLPYEHGQINSLKFSRNGKLLLVAGGRGGASGKAILYKVETGEKVTEVGANETDAILAADLSPDQTRIAVGTPTKMIRIYSTDDGSQLHQIKKHTDWVTSLEFSPDGVLLATGDRNGGAFVWEANTAREFHTLRGHTAAITDLSWRDDSNILASSSEDGTIRFWEMENGTAVKNWAAHSGGAASVKFSHDGKLVSTGRDKLTKLWDANGALQKSFEAFPDLGLRVAITHDNAVAIAGDWAGNAKAWTIADAKLAATFETNPLPAAERLQLATSQLAAAETRAQQTAAAYAPLKAAADKAAAELAAANKLIGDAQAALKAATDALPTAKADQAKFQGLVNALQLAETAKAVSATAYARAATEIQAAATNAPTNPMLAESAKKAQDLAKATQVEFETAKKASADNAASLKVISDKIAALTKTQSENTAVISATQPKLAGLQQASTNATTAANAAKAPADAAAAELAAAKARFEFVKESVDPAYALKKRQDALAALEARAKQLAEAATTAKANLDKATAELVAGQKAVVDLTALVKATGDAIAPAKAELDKLTAAAKPLQDAEAAKAAAATVAANAAKSAADAAAKAPQDANLAASAKTATALNAAAQADLDNAKKANSAHAAMLAAATAKFATATKAAADAKTALAAAQARVPVLQTAVTNATTAASAAKTAADAILPEVAAARAKVDQLKVSK